jgi:hypothetical protein
VGGFVGPTRLVMMNLPILKSYLDQSSIYVAGYGLFDAWDGFVFYESSDNANFSEKQSFVNGVNGGTVTDILESSTDTGTWDWSSTINVRMSNGILSSDSELNVLNGANAAAVGTGNAWEIIQWVTASVMRQT